MYLQQVFKLHGLPITLVSDQDAVFTSKFWSELFQLQGMELAMSTAYHPQSDGQNEIVNKGPEQYLRASVGDRPHQWVQWLPLAEFWYDTNFHTSLKLTPFEALYGFPPPKLQYIPGTTRVEAVLAQLKANIFLAQQRMKIQADKHRSDRSFAIGDWVYLKLQPYKHKSLAQKGK